MTADVRAIAAAALVALTALAATWLTLELHAHNRPKVEHVPAVHPTTSNPGPPVADWRPPQHRWETPPR